MLGPCRTRLLILTLAAASLTSVPMFAQMPAYMHSLAIPPAEVGTCMPLREITGRDSVPIVERHLVMVTADPAAHREMFQSVKADGSIGYSEYLIITYVTTASVSSRIGSGFSSGSTVVAAFSPQRGWSGRFFTDTTRASFALRPGGKMEKLPTPPDHRHAPRVLSPNEISSVRKLAAWMESRCRT